jgi:hypothetical protein
MSSKHLYGPHAKVVTGPALNIKHIEQVLKTKADPPQFVPHHKKR